MLFEGIMVLAAAADQAAKTWVEARDAKEFPRMMKNTGGRVMLYRNHNLGFPFGLCKGEKELVRMVPLVVTSMLGGVFLYLERRRKRPAARFALALTIGGSISNLYDRYVRRYVVDYFSLQFGPLKKVVFNLGDLCVFFGAGILAVLEIMDECGAKSRRKKEIMIDEPSKIV